MSQKMSYKRIAARLSTLCADIEILERRAKMAGLDDVADNLQTAKQWAMRAERVAMERS